MAFSWETFKSALGNFSNASVVYIDDEGSEIPIDCECEFQEALRLAKVNKNSLKLILYDKGKSNETIYMDQCQPVQSTANPSEKFMESKKKNMSPLFQSCKESICHSHGDVTPEWFSHYMKKFKKELLHELKSYIHDTVHSAVEKEKKLSHIKSETGESICEKNEVSLSSVGNQGKKKKKVLERDLIDLIDQRQIRLPKKLYVTRPERPSVSQRARMLVEENLKLIESKHQHKTKCLGASDKKSTSKKSASFLRSNLEVSLDGPSEFSLPICVMNSGNVRWSAPQLECFELTGLSPDKRRISLPSLHPMERHSIILTGKASKSPGFHYFKCIVVDNLERLSPELTCWTKVDFPVPLQNSSESVRQKDVTTHLIDFENEVVSSTQKKIEENINEIERSLQNIDLLQTSTYVETNPEGVEQISKKSDEVQTGCDLMLDLENKDVPSQGEDLLENNPLRTITPGSMCSSETDPAKEKNESPLNLNKIKKDEEMGSSSDSEFSIIFISEEEDNFFVVPSESFSPADSANEDKNSLNTETSDKSTRSVEKTQSKSAEPEIKNEIPDQTKGPSDETEGISNENFRQSQSSPTRSRCSPFGEEISKPKKMKSKSTEYCFTAANLTQPTFTHIPGFFEGRPSRFTFTGEKENSEKNDPQKTSSIPKKDALGRPIYAVDSRGRCMHVDSVMFKAGPSRMSPEIETLLRGKKNVDRDEGMQNRPERRNVAEHPSDMPAVNILPNVLNGASSVASYAFNTAKSVINNLQSAFVTEGKTELGEPASEDKVKPSTEALFKLYQMGFMDLETNRWLLTVHKNDLTYVINELLRLKENLSEEHQ